jgi:hypothetical protein
MIWDDQNVIVNVKNKALHQCARVLPDALVQPRGQNGFLR